MKNRFDPFRPIGLAILHLVERISGLENQIRRSALLAQQLVYLQRRVSAKRWQDQQP